MCIFEYTLHRSRSSSVWVCMAIFFITSAAQPICIKITVNCCFGLAIFVSTSPVPQEYQNSTMNQTLHQNDTHEPPADEPRDIISAMCYRVLQASNRKPRDSISTAVLLRRPATNSNDLRTTEYLEGKGYVLLGLPRPDGHGGARRTSAAAEAEDCASASAKAEDCARTAHHGTLGDSGGDGRER
mmetsp:Transcript_29114/g.63201  ORF Transcript_29114/g.63201 Transcript_29114/m.63201 type:complete len:185 (-) Transcript_29114:279-833(-)